MKLELTKKEIQKINEGALTSVLGSLTKNSPLVRVAKANIAGYKARQDSIDNGGNIFDRKKAYNDARRASYAGSDRVPKIASTQIRESGEDILRFMIDDYYRMFPIRMNAKGAVQSGIIPAGNGTVQVYNSGSASIRTMTPEQRDMNNAMFLLLEIANSI